ncbi:RING-type E3 ubiquitin transferase [Malassezia psittaci]|uniref:RING-type E3 ubiquitin transferase n=1 Tax=Malassezia psittaci TaxID=1821823 RepID=A0AAF0JCJ2_9BASI|nr:RING-type E3 ubiquitin transferase [Malassezia psittaci]
MRHAQIGVAQDGGGDAFLASVALDFSPQHKRPNNTVSEGSKILTCELLFNWSAQSGTSDEFRTLSEFWSYADLRLVQDWASRMAPGTLIDASHVALVDVVINDQVWITLPLARTCNMMWMPPLLQLEKEDCVSLSAQIKFRQDTLLLSLDAYVKPSSLLKTHTLAITQLFFRMITELHAWYNNAPLDTNAKRESDADLVYSSLSASEGKIERQSSVSNQPEGLIAHLLPFQRQSLAFLLNREALQNKTKSLGPWWIAIENTSLYFHLLTGELTEDAHRAQNQVRSAMLAEEMGLGKTVEILALLLKHPAVHRNSMASYFDTENDVEVQPVGTTLIVAPETLRGQWLEEIQMHTPNLRSYSFRGHKQASLDLKRSKYTSWVDWAKDLDVIVVSFETLTKELAVSTKAPVRNLRRPAQYERPRSPLVQLAFWRIVMDEVQLVGGNAAKTIAMIRRESSIAVSGTPVRRLDDLRTCLWFMNLIPSSAPTKLWQHILSPRMAPYLAALISRVGIRHTKAQVAHEMVFPPQQRKLVPVEFTYAESAFYRDVYREALEALDITEDGAPRSDNWQLDTSVLRAQLLRLRQACTHPHIAWRTGNTLESGAHVQGLTNLRSIDHVLTMMLDSARSELLTLKHNLILKRVFRASVLLFAPHHQLKAQQDNVKHPEDLALLHSLQAQDRLTLAQSQLENLLPEAHENLAQIEQNMEAARIQGPLYQFTEAELIAEAEFEASHKLQSMPWSAMPDAPHDKLQARQQHLTALRNRSRHWLQVLHRIHQFMGHGYYQMGEAIESSSHEDSHSQKPDSQETKQESDIPKEFLPKKREELRGKEEAAYAAAESTRQRLLSDAREAVEQCVEAMRRQRLVQHAELVPKFSASSFVGRTLLDEVQLRLATLSSHAELLLDWRNQVYERLSKPVNREVDKERENDDVYAENLDAQIEAETLLEMYRPLLAQREEILTGRIALGATARPQLYVELDRNLRAVKTRLISEVHQAPASEDTEDNEQQREAQKLQLAHFHRLELARKRVCLNGATPLSELVVRLREIRDNTSRNEEIQLLSSAISRLQDLLRTQTGLNDRLRKEQIAMQACFNARSLYFKQMQELSDQVQDPEISIGAIPTLLAALSQERSWRHRIASVEGRVRYLRHLEQLQAGGTDDEARRCFICTNLIETGILTNACGHLSCQTCFYAWMKEGRRTCPMCKTRLALNDVHRVVYRAGDDVQGGSSLHSGPTISSYNTLSESERNAIQRTQSQGRYGSKLDLLTKHLLYLRRTSGEKSLVFSSFSRGLDLVAESLRANNLAYARLEGSGSKKVGSTVERFQNSSEISVLLLHSEVQSAGLNLLAATHLFLLEPLMNHALELQAIGRVHRIGQTRATNVYCYMVNDTVEQRIVSLAASRQQCLYVARDDAANAADTMDSAALQAQHLQNADTVSREARRGDLMGTTDDLLACLFQEHIPTSVEVQPAGLESNHNYELDQMRAKRLEALQNRRS